MLDSAGASAPARGALAQRAFNKTRLQTTDGAANAAAQCSFQSVQVAHGAFAQASGAAAKVGNFLPATPAAVARSVAAPQLSAMLTVLRRGALSTSTSALPLTKGLLVPRLLYLALLLLVPLPAVAQAQFNASLRAACPNVQHRLQPTASSVSVDSNDPSKINIRDTGTSSNPWSVTLQDGTIWVRVLHMRLPSSIV